MSEEKYDYKLKITVLGESKVGKTSLICRYTKDEFALSYLSTVGVDYQLKTIKVDDKAVKLQIWDTAGQERFRTITKNFFTSTNGFVVCYDITSKESFNCVTMWLNEIKKNASEDKQVVLIGTKVDLDDERQVTKEQGQNLANNNKIPFFETSAKDGINLNETFETLSKKIIDVLKTKQPSEDRESRTSFTLKVDKKKDQETKKKCC